jgi:hypothetical protein
VFASKLSGDVVSDNRCPRSRALNTGLLALAALTAGIVASPPPALAQNFFDLLFGGFRRAVQPPPPQQPVYGDPNNAYPNYDSPDGLRGDGGPSVAFCVRTCDGRHFPIRAANPVEICNSFCPAAPTKVFFGSRIDYAHSSDGRTYRELPTAFAYREKLVEGCSCNGKDPFGLARLDVRDDPTLRPGDIVATNKGLMQATGRGSEFTPISGEMRRRLSEVKVAPSHDSEAGDDIPGYEPMRPLTAQGQAPAPAQAPTPVPPRNLRPQFSR